MNTQEKFNQNKIDAEINIKAALRALHNDKFNNIKVNNYALNQLQSAQSNYDGINGMTMQNIFDTKHIVNDLVAKNLLMDCYKYNHDPLAKQNYDIINHNHVPAVKMNNMFTPNNEMKLLNHDDLVNLATGMQKVIQFKPNAYKIMAHTKDTNPHLQGEHVNYALKSLVNYCIKHHQTKILKKHQLVEANAIESSLYLAPVDIQNKIKKQLKNMGSIGGSPHYINVVKIHNTNDNLDVTRPTAKDVDGVVNDLYLKQATLNSNKYLKQIRNTKKKLQDMNNYSSHLTPISITPKNIKQNQKRIKHKQRFQR